MTVWARLERSFIAVAAYFFRASPACRMATTSLRLSTLVDRAPASRHCSVASPAPAAEWNSRTSSPLTRSVICAP